MEIEHVGGILNSGKAPVCHYQDQSNSALLIKFVTAVSHTLYTLGSQEIGSK